MDFFFNIRPKGGALAHFAPPLGTRLLGTLNWIPVMPWDGILSDSCCFSNLNVWHKPRPHFNRTNKEQKNKQTQLLTKAFDGCRPHFIRTNKEKTKNKQRTNKQSCWQSSDQSCSWTQFVESVRRPAVAVVLLENSQTIFFTKLWQSFSWTIFYWKLCQSFSWTICSFRKIHKNT